LFSFSGSYGFFASIAGRRQSSSRVYVMPRRSLGGGDELHAPDLSLSGNDNDMEIRVAAFVAQSNAQYSYVTILVFDFVSNSAERLILASRPIGRAIALCGGLTYSHGNCGYGRQTQFLH
jgi:hypothetical protein